jgi:L-fucose isomerase
MNEKPVLGILVIAKKNHFKDEAYQLLDYYKKRFSAEKGIELRIEENVLFDEQEIAERARAMENEGADALLLAVGTWIYSSMVLSAVNDRTVPFILFGLSDKIANGNIGAAIQIRYVLEEMGKKFLFLNGKIRDEHNDAEILKYVRAAWVKKCLRNKKIATIGGKCMMMYQTQVNEFNWKSVFGVDFPQYDTAQVFKEMENVAEEDAKAVEQQFLSRIDTIHWEAGDGDQIDPGAIRTQAKMYLAFKRLKGLYGIDVFANKCMPEMSALPYGYGYAGCLATCMLNEDGIMTACEADVPAALSMYILHLLSGRPVFFADITRLNKPAKRITYFNCGTAPLSLADRSKGVSLWPIPANISDEAVPEEYCVNRMKGACINLELEEGREVTILRVGGNDGTLRFHAAKARTVKREVEPEEVLGNRWPGFGLEFQEDIGLFLGNTTGHHYSLAFGDYTRELEYLAGIYGIRFILNQ